MKFALPWAGLPSIILNVVLAEKITYEQAIELLG